MQGVVWGWLWTRVCRKRYGK